MTCISDSNALAHDANHHLMHHDGGGVMIQTTRRALELPNLNMMLKDLGWEKEEQEEQEEKSQLVLEIFS